MKPKLYLATLACVLAAVSCVTVKTPSPTHTFAIGTNDFLLDGQPFQIRCGEIHAARVPSGILAQPPADGQGDGTQHRLRLSLLESDRAAPGEIRLERPGGRRRILPHRAAGRPVGHSPSRPLFLRRMGNGRPAVVAVQKRRHQTPHARSALSGRREKLSARSRHACLARCKSPAAGRFSWCRSKTNTASTAKTPITWVTCGRPCLTPDSTCRCSIATRRAFQGWLPLRFVPRREFRFGPRGRVQGAARNFPARPADVRRVLSRLVRHLGRAASHSAIRRDIWPTSNTC